MLKEPFISVVLPVYNVAPYLREAVESILRQSMPDFEVVIVNDGSTDRSEEIIQELLPTDTRLRYFKMPKNSGLSAARNEGFLHVQGKYVYFMDSDDVLLPDAFRLATDRCLRDNLQVLVFDADIFCEEGTPPPTYDYHHTDIYDENKVYQGFPLLHDMFQHATFRSVSWLHLISVDWIRQLGLQFYPGIIHEDQLYTCLLMMQTPRVGVLKHSLIAHRMRYNSITTIRYSWRNVSCYLIVMDELFRYARLQEGTATLDLVREYTRYTLNPVLCTAKVLPLNEKIRTVKAVLRRGYVRYLKLRTIAVFLLKRR
jgi:glycosyltransferase involved in cell wall biosynthesis